MKDRYDGNPWWSKAWNFLKPRAETRDEYYGFRELEPMSYSQIVQGATYRHRTTHHVVEVLAPLPESTQTCPVVFFRRSNQPDAPVRSMAEAAFVTEFDAVR